MAQERRENTPSMKTANQSSIYTSMIVGVVVGIVGVYLRFAFDSWILSLVSWIILLIGTIISFRAVFKILNA